MLENLEKIIEQKGLFERKRKDSKTKALAVTLYYLGLSLRDISSVLDQMGLGYTSHESIRRWYHRLSEIFGNATKAICSKKRRRKNIALDETKIKLRDGWYYLWVAVDVERMEVVCARITRTRSTQDALGFLLDTLSATDGNPALWVDSGPWYKVIHGIGLRVIVHARSLRNLIETWFSIFKKRILRFYKRLSHNSSFGTMCSWIFSFIFLYNLEVGAC
jgi:transposase-like protein